MPKRKVKKRLKANKNFITIISCCAVTIVLALSLFNISSFYLSKKVLGAATERRNQAELRKEASFWETFLSKNPNYLDGWIELSNLESALRNKDYAAGAANTARAINPNSEKVKVLLGRLGF